MYLLTSRFKGLIQKGYPQQFNVLSRAFLKLKGCLNAPDQMQGRWEMQRAGRKGHTLALAGIASQHQQDVTDCEGTKWMLHRSVCKVVLRMIVHTHWKVGSWQTQGVGERAMPENKTFKVIMSLLILCVCDDTWVIQYSVFGGRPTFSVLQINNVFLPTHTHIYDSVWMTLEPGPWFQSFRSGLQSWPSHSFCDDILYVQVVNCSLNCTFNSGSNII